MAQQSIALDMKPGGVHVRVHADVKGGLGVHETCYVHSDTGALHMQEHLWTITHVASGLALIKSARSKRDALKARSALLALGSPWTGPIIELAGMEEPALDAIEQALPYYKEACQRAREQEIKFPLPATKE